MTTTREAGYELHAAGVLADDPGQAWLLLWVQTLVLTALLGGEGGVRLDADLAIAGIGISPPLRLRHAARMMGTGGHGRQPGWLEAVLSWPQRFIRPDPATPGPADPDVPGTATG